MSSKRISVFDRLGPGNDEPGTVHRRYSSEKHVGAPAGQEKGRGHSYGPSAPSSHIRIEDRETPPIRDRKSRHRGEFPGSNLPDTESLEEKRPPNPPPMKSTPDVAALKGVSAGVKVTRPPGTMGSGESDYDSGEEGKKRKGYHGDHDVARRPKHGGEGSEEEASRRGRGKEKAHAHTERPGSSAGRHRSPPVDVAAKAPRPRREPVSVPHDHKRRKEDEAKPPPELGHKRKRDHLEDGHLPDVKRVRHAEHHGASRDVERHHGNAGKEADYLHGSVDRKWRQESGGSEPSSRKQHRSRSPRTPVPAGGDRERGRGSGKGHNYGSRDGGKKSTDKEHNRGNETTKKSRGLDWSTVNEFTEKANSKLNYHPSKSVLGNFTPAAVLMGIEISPLLAGADLFGRTVELIKARSKTVEQPNLLSYWMDILEGPESVSTPRTPVRSALDWDKTISKSLGACRRALTASDDYTLRRLLRKDQHRSFIGRVRSPPNSWAAGHYEIALEFYQALPTKPSGKPAHRIQTSKVGTLVL